MKRLALLGILVLAAVWRLPATEREWRFLLCENDSLFHLHRVQACLAHYPVVPSIDAYAHFPHGYRVHWIALHTLFYASVVKLARVTPERIDDLVRAVSWIPPALGLVSVLLAMAVVGCFTRNSVCRYSVGLLCAFSAEACRPFFYGTIDHHLFAHLGVLLLVLGRLRRWQWCWTLGLISLLAMTPEAIIYVTAFLGCLFLSDLAAQICRSERVQTAWGWYLAPLVVCALVWAAHRSLETEPLPVFELSWVYLSAFQVLWFGLLGVGLKLALSIVGWSLPARSGRLVAVVSTSLALVAALALGFLYWAGALATIVSRLLVSHRIFVGEEAFVFHAGFWRAPAWYRLLAFSGIFLFVKLVGGVRRRADAEYFFGWISLSMALVLGLKEFRHMYVLSSLQLVGLTLAAVETARALQRLPIFSSRIGRVVPAMALALAIVPVLVSGDVINRAAVHGEVCAELPVIEQLAAWLRERTPDGAAGTHATPAYGVFNPWSIGHHVHVLGRQPVVVDPLNYETEAGVEEALQTVWWAQTADEFLGALERYGVRYVVLTNPGEDIVGVARKRALRAEEFVTITDRGESVFGPAMYRFAGFRLFMTSGWSGEFGRLEPRFFTTDVEIYRAGGVGDSAPTTVIIPKGQIYEVKPGAVISGVAPHGDTEVAARYVVQRREGPAVVIRIPLAVEPDGRFQFRTALPAPSEGGGFRVLSGYTFTATGREAVVSVTQEMVDRGTKVPLEWSTPTQ